ncbi:MAG: YggS family pyridoxal phosphate-dependent enzyme [Microcoleaceae cyanobacterium]
MTDSIATRIAKIGAEIPPSVRLIAVSKQVSVDAMRVAYEMGIRDFGESRIQEATQKQALLQDLPDITWHFIGHLQANKALKAIALFQWIHSVDNLKLAQRLNHIAQELSRSPEICLQVKMLPDPNKHGWTVPELLKDLPLLNQCQNLQIKGLMVIPPLGLNETETLTLFKEARNLRITIQEQNWSHIKIQELSMGMSQDYPLAIEAGATMIRLGSILFGDR